MKSFTYRGCEIDPEVMDEPTLVACNNSVNRYLRKVWRITFPDQTWTRVGTKDTAKSYINLALPHHKAA